MEIQYRPKGVCARQMNVHVENGIVENVQIIGGCAGNLMGLSMLVKGRPVEEVVEALKGIRCGDKSTSCPDQLAMALSQALAQAAEE